MKKLFLDDVRDPKKDGFFVVRSFTEAVEYMEINGCPNFMSFDHDLGEVNCGTGFDLAKWMVERDLDMGGTFIPKDFQFYVHSANGPGTLNIRALLYNYLAFRGSEY